MPVGRPRLVEAFFQANTIDGYGYLDVRGALARQFASQFNSVSEVVEGDNTSLILSQPKTSRQPITEIKVNIASVWIHFRSDVDRVSIREESSRVVNDACALMGVTRLSRQGLRVYYLFPTQTPEEATQILRPIAAGPTNWEQIGKVSAASFAVHIESKRLKAAVALRAVRRQAAQVTVSTQNEAPSSELAAFGVLLDTDLYNETPSDTRDPKPHINRAMDFLSDSLVPYVSQLLEEPR